MKSGIIAVVSAGVVLAGGIAYAFVNNTDRGVVVSAVNAEEPAAATDAPTSPDERTQAVEVMHVDELAAAPENFPNEVTLRAVVSGVNESQGVFSVIDTREYEACGVLSCAKFYLPVRYEGELPTPKTLLQITGQVVRSEKGLVFEASQVEATQ